MKRLLPASVAVLAVLGVSGCASASLTQLWRDPSYRSRPVNRILVVSAMPRSANPGQFENAVAQALTEKGFQAATGAGLFPEGRLDKMKVQKYVNDNGVDLLIMERLSTEKAAPVVVTTTVAQGGWYGGAVASSSQVVSQGTNVTARIDVYDVRTEPDTLIWTGESNAIDMQGAAQSFAAELMKALIAAQILVK
jgi:hypothetical protein